MSTETDGFDRIELLAPRLLDQERRMVAEAAGLAKTLRISLGWHYLLDIAWTCRLVSGTPGERVLDAGAGVGIMQWLLASHGADVVSVDRLDRSRLSSRFRARFSVSGVGRSDLRPIARSIAADVRSGALVVDASRNLSAIVGRIAGRRRPLGRISILNSPLDQLGQLPDASVDAIVSISSLEHNDPEAIPAVVAELWRVLRPGGVFTATVGAAEKDWYHGPSRGWCFSEETVKALFGLPRDVPSNYAEYGAILESVRANEELRRGLARSYFRSGNNGMPWGKWDPQYLSVGICRRKPA